MSKFKDGDKVLVTDRGTVTRSTQTGESVFVTFSDGAGGWFESSDLVLAPREWQKGDVGRDREGNIVYRHDDFWTDSIDDLVVDADDVPEWNKWNQDDFTGEITLIGHIDVEALNG